MNLREPVPVRVRGTDYPSQCAAARALGVDHSTVGSAIERGTVDNIGRGRGRFPKRPCIIDGVAYPSVRAAARALGVNPSVIHRWLSQTRNEP